jgi:hypothetical protein
VYPPVVARQRVSRNVTAVTSTHARTDELLDASFSMLPCRIRGKQEISSSQNFLLCTLSFILQTNLNNYGKTKKYASEDKNAEEDSNI